MATMDYSLASPFSYRENLFLQGVYGANVMSFGAQGDGVTDDTAAIQLAINSMVNGGLVIFPIGKTFKVNGTIFCSSHTNDIEIVIPKGTTIVQYADLPVFKSEGSLGTSQALTANATAGNRTVNTTDATLYAAKSWIYIASSNTISGTTDKLAAIRQVVSTTSTVVTFDKALYRSMFTAQTAHIRPVTLVPSVAITGGGQIRHVDSTNFQMLIDFVLVENPIVAIEVGPNGGPGVAFSHCIGGGTTPQFYVHDLEDDGSRFGYGINMGGACRDMTILGLAARCRHAFTTNTGPNITNSANYGEPENIKVSLQTVNCSNKALDTHRAGWGVTFYLNNSGGSAGAVQIRADNTTVVGGSTGGANSVGIAVTSDVAVRAIIDGVAVTDTAGAGGIGILLQGPALVSGCHVYRYTGTGIDIQAAGCVLADNVIDGPATGSLKGIKIGTSGNKLRGGYITGNGTGIEVAAGQTGNEYSTVDFGTNTSNVVLL